MPWRILGATIAFALLQIIREEWPPSSIALFFTRSRGNCLCRCLVERGKTFYMFFYPLSHSPFLSLSLALREGTIQGEIDTGRRIKRKIAEKRFSPSTQKHRHSFVDGSDPEVQVRTRRVDPKISGFRFPELRFRYFDELTALYILGGTEGLLERFCNNASLHQNP